MIVVLVVAASIMLVVVDVVVPVVGVMLVFGGSCSAGSLCGHDAGGCACSSAGGWRLYWCLVLMLGGGHTSGSCSCSDAGR